ncbi:FAD/NAD-P-binding domain-containing protein [Mycena maculata]|uniref:FAD/NAD-P-binding domain-containing protein n=1 Tax=Mycena maculata TaxID=230809 RepID=A0AAD7NI47_9AGAR|nr:FAD/NAD-P-binding domain-containing protein [Mycena maculata]
MHLVFTLLSAAILSAAAQQEPFSSQPTDQWTVFHHPIKRVAVIGAGPAGLKAAAEFLEHNFTVRLFDRAPQPGGNWFYTEETPAREPYPDRPIDEEPYVPSDLPATRYFAEGEDGISLEERWKRHWQPRPVWNSLHSNTPSVGTEITEVPYPPDTPWVLSAHQIQRHVRAYASLVNLNSNDYQTRSSVTAYSTRVEKLEKIESSHTWRLTLRRLERLSETHRIKVQWWTEEFDAVVIATGPYVSPHVPDIEGIVDWSKATEAGRHSIYHSQSYRRPERYQNKANASLTQVHPNFNSPQTVLVVGASVSASEISRDIAPYAQKIFASIRPRKDGRRFRTLRRFPDEAEFIPEIARFEPLEAHDKGIKDGEVHLVNGTVLGGIDEVILATGFVTSVLFLPNFTADGQPADLHWSGLYIPDPTLGYTNVRPWTMGKYQSYLFAKVWEGTAHLPTLKEMRKVYDSGKYRHRVLPAEALVRQYVAWLNNESLENGGRFVESWPLVNREIYAYYLNVEWNETSSLKNFTDFEALPAREWWQFAGRQESVDEVWDALVYPDQDW